MAGSRKYTEKTKDILFDLYHVQKKTCAEISRILKVQNRTIYKWFKKLGIKIEKHRKRPYRTIDLTDQRFGKLVVIRKKKNSKFAYWICKCDCNKRKSIYGYSLRKGIATHCGCETYKGKGDLSGSQLSSMRHGAKERNLEFNLTKEFLWSLFLKQKRRCAISGMRIKLEKSMHSKRKTNTASLDRIDNTQGYSENNVQWVYKDINIMKRNHEEKYFVELCTNISEFNKNKLNNEIVF